MTRLLRGIGLIGLAAVFVGCGDDDNKAPAPLCDGGACTDAKRDVSAETQTKLDVADGSADQIASPDLGRDQAIEAPLDVALPDAGPDTARPLDTLLPQPDTAGKLDQAPVPDAPITLDVDVGVDSAAPRLDTAAIDTGDIDAGGVDTTLPDLSPVRLDSAEPDDSSSDAPDTSAGDADASDAGCAGVLCNGFEGDDTDAGVIPAGWTVVSTGTGWSMALDNTNRVLQQGTSSNATSFIETGTAWTDMTVTIRIKLLSVGNNDTVLLCGRFAATNTDGYCLNISSGNTGTTPGNLALPVRQGGNVAVLTGADTSASALPITVGTWHTYRMVISGAGPVTVSAYLDDASTPTVTGTHASSPYLTSGNFGIGVRRATADFDDLVIASP
jgi:hypothetical protein